MFFLLVASYLYSTIAIQPTPPTQPTTLIPPSVPVYIALYQNNIELLKDKLRDLSNPLSNNYRKWMEIDEINSYIHPSLQHQTNVLSWINNYEVTEVKNYGDNIKFQAAPNVIQDMFGLNTSDHNKLVNYQIPSYLKPVIKFVEMSTNPIIKKPKINRTRLDNNTDDRYFAREPLRRLYNVSNSSLEGNVSGGLIEYLNNAGFTNGDLNKQQTSNRQVNNNITNIIGVNYDINEESELDVQLMSQAADGISLWYWNTPYWLYSLAVDFYNREDIPDVISMSWGWAEDSQCDIIDCTNITSQEYVSRVNNEYLKISLRGTTIVVASGDAGAPGRTNEGCNIGRAINPVFPGSSPYVVSSGATYVPLDSTNVTYQSPICLNNSCISSLDERSISYEHVGWTAGGGFSLYETETPTWQRDFVEIFLATTASLPNETSFNRHGRAYPDLSAIGHSCPTYLNGELASVDGTSCSAPVIAGLLSIINDHEWKRNRTRLGFVNPLLYHMANACPKCFHDIKVGHNWCTEDGCCENKTQFGYQATEGYDTVTGLGTLNVGNILEFLDRLN